jgi:hypothetical protein
MCVCMCICVYVKVCMYARAHAYMHIHAYIHGYVCMYMHVCMYVCWCACVCVCITWCMCVCVYNLVHEWYMYVSILLRMYVCVYNLADKSGILTGLSARQSSIKIPNINVKETYLCITLWTNAASWYASLPGNTGPGLTVRTSNSNSPPNKGVAKASPPPNILKSQWPDTFTIESQCKSTCENSCLGCWLAGSWSTAAGPGSCLRDMHVCTCYIDR